MFFSHRSNKVRYKFDLKFIQVGLSFLFTKKTIDINQLNSYGKPTSINYNNKYKLIRLFQNIGKSGNKQKTEMSETNHLHYIYTPNK